jgi:hypothetical protein
MAITTSTLDYPRLAAVRFPRPAFPGRPPSSECRHVDPPSHKPTFFLVRFWEFFGKGSAKTPQKYFYKQSMSKTFPKKIGENFDVSFSSTFFILPHFRVFLSDGRSKTLRKTFCKKSHRKVFIKKTTKIENCFFLGFIYHVFGHFSVRGVQKHHNKYPKNKFGPGPFLGPDPPTHHGG